jgi:hypothetical protein
MVFDVSRKWCILAAASVPAVRNAADELALYVSLFRERAGLGGERPPIEDAETSSPPVMAPVIILNAVAGSRDRSGFTWRIGRGRIEINGDSDRGLWNGIFDFLASLGVLWPQPGQEELPAPPAGTKPALYPLKSDRAYSPSLSSVKDRRRLVVSEKAKTDELEPLIRWAARNKYDALVFSFREKALWHKVRRGKGIGRIIERYALILEAGGHDMSLLLRRRLFFFHKDLFRMDSGQRVREHHFCPTNPQTTRYVMDRAGELFSMALPGTAAWEPANRIDAPRPAEAAARSTPVFHLWPDSGHEKTWCACPACRAFSPEEQNHIAVNSAADALAALDPKARLSFFEIPVETDSSDEAGIPAARGVVPRENTFALNRYPDEG